jgi:hypothetical protein
MVVFRYKTIWLSSSFRFWTWFERLVLFVTGMTNIRDVIPFQEHHWTQSFNFYWNFSLRRINSFYQKSSRHFFLNILPRKAKALRKLQLL